MRLFDKDYSVTRVDANSFRLSFGKESVVVRRSPANDGSWSPMSKWFGVTFHVDSVGNLIKGRP